MDFSLNGMSQFPSQDTFGTVNPYAGAPGQGLQMPNYAQPDPNATAAVPGQQPKVPGQTMAQMMGRMLMQGGNSHPFQAPVLTAYGSAPNLMRNG